MMDKFLLAAMLLLLAGLAYYVMVQNGTKPATPAVVKTTPLTEGFTEPQVYEYIYDPMGVYIGKRLKSQ